MSWTQESIVAGFPRDNTHYFIQFIQEPKVVEKQGKWGSWTELSCNLQFFGRDEQQQFHYMSDAQVMLKPCALEDLSFFGPDIVTRLIHVKGRQHGKHVDLTLENDWDRISARDAQEQEGPSKPVVAADKPSLATNAAPPAAASPAAQRGQPQVGEDPPTPTACSHENCKFMPQQVDANNPTNVLIEGFYCKDCGERVG